MQQLILDIRPDAPPTFANYLAGRNQEAVAALTAFAAGEMQEALIYLWGESGSGRSHLLKACVHACIELGSRADYRTSRESLPETLPGLLAVDDVDTLDDVGQVALFNLINRAREGEGRLLAAGSAPPAQLSLRVDLTTRLGWGLVFGIQRPDEAERATALRSRALARGMHLPEEVIHYMLSHCRRDLPALLATVDALDTYSLSLKRPPTLPLLRALLQDRP